MQSAISRRFLIEDALFACLHTYKQSIMVFAFLLKGFGDIVYIKINKYV